MNAATEQAFKGMIPINKYGFLVLNIEMNPEMVDVNVHPAKLEVRFEEENKVFKAVYHAIKDALSQSELVENVSKEDNKQEKPVEKEMDQNLIEEIYKFREGLKEIGVAEAPATTYQISDLIKEKEEKDNNEESQSSNIPTEQQVNEMTEELIKQRETRAILDEAIASTTNSSMIPENSEEKQDFNTMYNNFFGIDSKNAESNELTNDIEKSNDNIEKIDTLEEITGEKKNVSNENQNDNINNNVLQEQEFTPYIQEENEKIDEFKNMKNNNYKFIGIVFDTYIIVQIENEMYILDQHAAHERIRYETVKKNYFSTVNRDCQLMLMPDVITLTHKEVETIKENVEMFERAGFDLEAFGENTIKLNGVPSYCMDLDTKQLFIELLDEVGEYSRTARQEKEDHFLATIACKSAVKAKMKLGKEEVDALMNELLELPNPFTCPHGRPTAIKMSKYDLDKNFSRVM